MAPAGRMIGAMWSFPRVAPEKGDTSGGAACNAGTRFGSYGT